jgi:hypothetical protein
VHELDAVSANKKQGSLSGGPALVFVKLLNTQYSVILFVGVVGGLCVNLVLRNNKQGFPIHLHIRIECPAMAEISKNANKLFHNHWPKKRIHIFSCGNGE